jgi:hypothetical protein
VGWHPGIGPEALYHQLHTRHYWASYNLDLDQFPAVRGVQMRQWARRSSDVPNGIAIPFDVNTVLTDKLGGLPLMVIAACGEGPRARASYDLRRGGIRAARAPRVDCHRRDRVTARRLLGVPRRRATGDVLAMKLKVKDDSLKTAIHVRDSVEEQIAHLEKYAAQLHDTVRLADRRADSLTRVAERHRTFRLRVIDSLHVAVTASDSDHHEEIHEVPIQITEQLALDSAALGAQDDRAEKKDRELAVRMTEIGALKKTVQLDSVAIRQLEGKVADLETREDPTLHVQGGCRRRARRSPPSSKSPRSSSTDAAPPPHNLTRRPNDEFHRVVRIARHQWRGRTPRARRDRQRCRAQGRLVEGSLRSRAATCTARVPDRLGAAA